MEIEQYLNRIHGRGKRFAALIVTPKDRYPTNFNDEKYWDFVDSILLNPSHYIGVFQTERPEMMQEVAFKIFVRPLIADYYHLSTKTTDYAPRAKHENIEAFWVAKSFYAHVPYGEMTEEEAIKKGLGLAEEFLDKYPIGSYEFVVKDINRHDDGASILNDLAFNKADSDYYFDFVYIC